MSEVFQGELDITGHGNMDWEICIFCQKITSETLQCPLDSKRKDVHLGAGYQTLAQTLQDFGELGLLPKPLSLLNLEQGVSLSEIFTDKKAKWHPSCRIKYNTTELQRAEKRKSKEIELKEEYIDTKLTRHSLGARCSESPSNKCFFCEKVSGELRKASTFKIDSRVRECALTLQDTVLIAKLSGGDMVAQDAMYHPACLLALYDKAKKAQEDTSSTDDRESHAIALAELICYIEESRDGICGDSIKVFRLADLKKMYIARVKQLEKDTASQQYLHTTRLKDQIMSHFPEMQCCKDGKNVLLAFREEVGTVLKDAYTCKSNVTDDVLILAKAAKIIRRGMFDQAYSNFNGSFSKSCQQDSVPNSLKVLVSMILLGPNIKSQSSNAVEEQVALSLSQLIIFNSSIRRRKESTSTVHHSILREPPLPVYLGLLLHAKTRKRGLVDRLYGLGLSISYSRVLDISTEMGNQICSQFEIEEAVCPSKLREGILTIGAVDNIDHNPTSTTAQGSLHGTGISLFQQPTKEIPGEERIIFRTAQDAQKKRTLSPLPEVYSTVHPVEAWTKTPSVPPVPCLPNVQFQILPAMYRRQYAWLDHIQNELETNPRESNEKNVTWASFYASSADVSEDPPSISTLLPLFQEEAKSVAMIKHAIDVVKTSVEFLNPGQSPIIVCDQPLYAVAKRIQWHWPELYGEDKLVVMLGGLHIEMAVMKALGSWLEGSGWTNCLVTADIASVGTADSFLTASHVSRTLHVHQVTVGALYILMHKAYKIWCDRIVPSEIVEFETWRECRAAEIPQFQFWSITLDFQMTILLFVQSLREANFQLYKESLVKLVPWLFALNHTNYARWLPVHIRDMSVLDATHPEIASKFREGYFVIRKSGRPFSAIPIDQAHEQNNKCVKGDGGAIGLTENSTQLLRWMVCGPEIARAIGEFETSQDIIQVKGPDVFHHEQVKGTRTVFMRQVASLVSTIEEVGNPFQEQSQDLLVLDSRDIAPDEMKKSVYSVCDVGEKQYAAFVEDRLIKQNVPLDAVIKKNQFVLFSYQPGQKGRKNDKLQISSLKKDCSLFSQLYISCQVREGNLVEFFSHENQSFPPSLSQYGNLRSGNKSDLIGCLEKLCNPNPGAPEIDVVLLDGAAVVNMLKPGTNIKTFQDYATLMFLPYVTKQLQNASRVDIVWDVYVPHSLKAMARSKRGQGQRRRVEPHSRLPGNWEAFLRVDENKTELFHYLAEQTILIESGEKQIISTKGNVALCNTDKDLSRLAPCTQEEADTRLLLHAADAAMCGSRRALLRTVDTDVVVLAVALVMETGLDELWVAFGTKGHFRYIPCHDIASTLGPERSRALLTFHAFTGCDQVSFFYGKGKATGWSTWMIFEDVTPIFKALSINPTRDVIPEVMAVIQRFVVLMYDRASTSMSVNEARLVLFTQKGRSLENIPPTEASLLQHVMRASYQAGFCWGQALIRDPFMPCPSEWGYAKSMESHAWRPVWTLLPDASKSCQELLKCSCKVEGGCSGRCKCVKAALQCTALCRCGGNCERN